MGEMKKLMDLTGMTFGSWTVVERVENDKNGAPMWKCRCNCGKISIVRGQTLRSGKSQGCHACLWTRQQHPRVHTDGSRRWVNNKRTRIYNTWLGMKARCNNPGNKAYKNYGARGIRVCEQWNKDFQSFFDYVSKLEHYGEEKRTLDRIDNEVGYEPGNVRWATYSEQQLNKRKKA